MLFGYIARITRAGVIEAIDADYTRTAYLKGLTQRQVVGRHVLRNSLLPTIAVVATQVGYLIGGLLVIEKLFNYNGIGQRIYTAAQNKDFPMLQSGVLMIGHRLPRRHARRRHPLLRVQPAHPLRSRRMSADRGAAIVPRRCAGEARIARRETVRQLAPLEDFILGAADRRCSGSSGRSPARAYAARPARADARSCSAADPAHWFGTDQLGRDVLSRVLAGASDTMKVAPLATLLGIVGGTPSG